MDVKQAFLLALKSIKSSKMRSFLTMLGIIIGVAAVIVLVSLINGMSDKMISSFESMGTNLISVNIMGRGGNRTVTPEQMEELAEKNKDIISGVTPSVAVQGAVIKYENENISTTSTTGVSDAYDDIRNTKLTAGRFITYTDVKNRLKNCVVGSYVVKQFFTSDEAALGKKIKINGNEFTIVGVMKETASSAAGSNDDAIFIPYTVAQKIAKTRISSYSFSAANKDTIARAKTAIEDYLYNIFNDTNAYRVFNLSDAIDSVNEMMSLLTLVLVGIAGISLIVGGIGIMNIMLVSVTERTREIGIRKALGAAPWEILSQFVVEAITTSAIGGVLGIGIGIAGSYIAADLIGMTARISVLSILVAFSVSASIGVIFGYLPAKKAAGLNPIDALRYE